MNIFRKHYLSVIFGLGAFLILFQNFDNIKYNQSSIVRPVRPPQENKVTTKSECAPDKYQEIRESATVEKSQVIIDCSAKLQGRDRISKRLIFMGPESSDVVFDCAGAVLDGLKINDGKAMIEVRSKVLTNSNKELTWQRPERVIIKNCNVQGSARIYGMAKNGEGENLKLSSRSEGHTQRAQKNAPTNITFDKMNIVGESSIPLYISPGVTNFTLKNSRISGSSASVAIYLDAESANNLIENNIINVKSKKRELVAIDGSAGNLIKNNHFSQMVNGGIFLYRNCGEGGNIRHQTPSKNRIEYNKFDGRSLRGGSIFGFPQSEEGDYQSSTPYIFLSSRDGDRKYCGQDNGYPFGSSKDNRDFAENNIVSHNQFRGRSSSLVVDRHPGANVITDNKVVNEFTENELVEDEQPEIKQFCEVPNAYPDSHLENGESVSEFLVNGKRQCTGVSLLCKEGNLIKSQIKCSSTSTENQGSAVEKSFECQAVGDNLGCSKEFDCPQGMRVSKIKAACNLEYGKITKEQIDLMPWNQLRVDIESDHRSDGECQIDQTHIANSSVVLDSIKGKAGFNFHCHERDGNGGDCHILGKVICAP